MDYMSSNLQFRNTTFIKPIGKLTRHSLKVKYTQAEDNVRTAKITMILDQLSDPFVAYQTLFKLTVLGMNIVNRLAVTLRKTTS